MPKTKTQRVQLFYKDNQNVTFHELKSTLKKGNIVIGCIFVELCLFFCFGAAEGARKLMKPKYIFASPGKPEL